MIDFEFEYKPHNTQSFFSIEYRTTYFPTKLQQNIPKHKVNWQIRNKNN